MADHKVKDVPLTLAAQQLRRSYLATRDLVLRGALRGRQQDGRWYVDRGDLRRLVRERTLDTTTVDA